MRIICILQYRNREITKIKKWYKSPGIEFLQSAVMTKDIDKTNELPLLAGIIRRFFEHGHGHFFHEYSLPIRQ